MKEKLLLCAKFFLLLITGSLASMAWAQVGADRTKAGEPLASWVELGENGTIVARQVIEISDKAPACPSITVNSAPTPIQMQERKNHHRKRFPVLLCEAAIPSGATSASIGSVKLRLPKDKISNIVLVGDTGCKGPTGPGMKVTPLEEPKEEEEEEALSPADKSNAPQDCMDPSKWPLGTIAEKAAGKNPDLVVHVGDYVYVKEDTWEQWNAQFFQKASPLLQAAPWIFVRGNHETCKLHGDGFFYLLDPRKDASCPNDHSDPYLVKTGGSQFVVMDSSGADCDFGPGEPGDCDKGTDKGDKKQGNEYEREVTKWTGLFGTAKNLIPAGSQAFLLTHRPVWGIKPPTLTWVPPQGYCYVKDDGRMYVAINSALEAAYQQAKMTGIKMVLSGHIHNFQLVTYKDQAPVPQLVVGDSGVKMSTPPPDTMNNCKVTTVNNGFLTVSNFYGMKQFGFGVLPVDATTFDLYLPNGNFGLQCTQINRNAASCH